MDDLDRIIQEYKDTVPKNRRRYNNRHQKEFRERHNVRSFSVEFKDDEGLGEILDRLTADGITRKDFIKQSFEIYKQMGGFGKSKSAIDEQAEIILARQKEILARMKVNPKETFYTLADFFKISEQTIARDIAELKKGGYLIRKGGNTAKGYWEVTNKQLTKREV